MAKVMYQGKEVEAIDCTPTWEGMLRYYITILRDGTNEGQKIAEAELTNMAKAADKWVAHCKQMKEGNEQEPTGSLDKVKAIKALIDGDYDNEALLKFGSLHAELELNLLHILNHK
jgi:hypothetical protein